MRIGAMWNCLNKGGSGNADVVPQVGYKREGGEMNSSLLFSFFYSWPSLLRRDAGKFTHTPALVNETPDTTLPSLSSALAILDF